MQPNTLFYFTFILYFIFISCLHIFLARISPTNFVLILRHLLDFYFLFCYFILVEFNVFPLILAGFFLQHPTPSIAKRVLTWSFLTLSDPPPPRHIKECTMPVQELLKFTCKPRKYSFSNHFPFYIILFSFIDHIHILRTMYDFKCGGGV